MKQRSKLLFAAMLIATSTAAHAEPQCIPTPKLTTAHYPGAAAIPTTNNLILPTGKSIETVGQRLVIRAQVLDLHCMPVPNAVVEIWHANPYGKARIADKSELSTPYPAFAGAGRTITDTDGQFTFTTAFPGVGTYSVNKRQYAIRAPQINLRISAPGMKDFTTVLYFENDRRNENDAAYKRLSLERRSAVTMRVVPEEESLNSTIQLVLPAYAQYRTY